MRYIETKHRILQEVTQFKNREEASAWLWRTLKLHYKLQIRDVKDDRDFRDFWDVHNAPTEGIGNIYHDLRTEDQKLYFRQAIGDCLSQHENEKDVPLDIRRDLIYLIGETKAVESLGAFLPTIGNGFLGKEHPEVWYDVISNLMTFHPSPQVQETVFQLANSSNFDDGYILEIIGILVRCDPSTVSDLLSLFQPRLEKLRQNCKNLGGKEWTAYCGGVEDFVAKIKRLNSNLDPTAINKMLLG